jgi:succinate dehydrogenase hydrophobic anchor subunit
MALVIRWLCRSVFALFLYLLTIVLSVLPWFTTSEWTSWMNEWMNEWMNALYSHKLCIYSYREDAYDISEGVAD